jgi:hypothetical protein
VYIKRLLISLVALLVLLTMSVLPALGQDARWFAYVYNGRDLVRVYQDGAQETYNVGLGENVFVGSREMAFNAEGSHAAFCATSYPPAVEGQESPPPSTHVYLRDIAAQTNLLDVDLGSAIGCRVGENGLSADGSRLAVGVINYMFADQATDPGQPAWQLLVLDAATGSVAYELNAQSPAAVNAFGAASGPTMPFVQKVETGSVVFAPVPWFSEGFIDAAYRWDLASGAVAPETGEQWAQFRVDALGVTGETTWTGVDPNLPALQPMGIGLAFNVLRVADSSGQVTTIYHNGEANPFDARFINNGQQVAAMVQPPFDESNPNAPIQYRWIAVDRTGSVTDLFTVTAFTYLEGAPDGYVHLVWDSPNQDPTNATFRLIYTANGQATELWSMAGSADQFGAWELAWAAPMPAAPGLPPFTAIAS